MKTHTLHIIEIHEGHIQWRVDCPGLDESNCKITQDYVFECGAQHWLYHIESDCIGPLKGNGPWDVVVKWEDGVATLHQIDRTITMQCGCSVDCKKSVTVDLVRFESIHGGPDSRPQVRDTFPELSVDEIDILFYGKSGVCMTAES